MKGRRGAGRWESARGTEDRWCGWEEQSGARWWLGTCSQLSFCFLAFWESSPPGKLLQILLLPDSQGARASRLESRRQLGRSGSQAEVW